ncbi:MAG: hypothetical protein LBR94_03885 [Desulfovibrio sp.]|jgi:hypothetical protein|nr:hypothetical protein [Desulfovibrio sp.]
MSTTAISLPRLVKIRQTFPRPKVENIEAAMAGEMRKLLRAADVGAGKTVGITVGSRGVGNIVPMLRAAIAEVRNAGSRPVMLAAMGSHGGGTPEGQKELLDSLGITGEALGAEILTCAEGREIGVTSRGLRAYMLDSAFGVDVIIPVNRVKTHTSFKGDIESGMIKKLVVGLGGPQGARQFHSQGKAADLPILLQDVGRLILEKMPVIGGIGIVENAYEETALIRAIPAGDLLREEAGLLRYSKELMPSLPATRLDALIVEEMGKNYSGTGIDINIVGRLYIQGEPEPQEPFIRYLAVLDLSGESHGNACGVGLADFTTRRLVDKIDRKHTYLNSLTATFPKRAFIPVYLDTEKEIVETMFRCLSGSVPPEKVRLVVIPNTLFLAECYVTEALLEQFAGREDIEIIGRPEPMTFTDAGELRQRIGRALH